MIAKRERGKMERKLIASLTKACEEAKPMLTGFSWLTHTVDYQRFPESLVVTWVFDTNANLTGAIKSETRKDIHHLTAQALADAGVDIDSLERHVDLDSEEACQRAHAGDWQSRLRQKSVKH
ncbi:hypothetical protein ACTXGQ_15255 [Marinobacter sp. 1Y8]